MMPLRIAPPSSHPELSERNGAESAAQNILTLQPWKSDSSFHALLAEEIDPVAGPEPIVWLLLTSREIESSEDAKELIFYYPGRWEIEVFHRVLKTGGRGAQAMWQGLERVRIFGVAWQALGDPDY